VVSGAVTITIEQLKEKAKDVHGQERTAGARGAREGVRRDEERDREIAPAKYPAFLEAISNA
jgi:hypothetical protein